MALAIEKYALIGDCETAALVGNDGSIDWLCWPRFDSAACLAALLGGVEHGRWLVGPRAAAYRVQRRYRAGTLTLETDFETADAAITLVDFMPVEKSPTSNLVRIVVGRRGTMAMQCELVLRFDYGSVVPWVTRLPNGQLRAIAGPDLVTLSCDVPLRGENLTTKSEFEIHEGQRLAFVLTYCPSHLEPPAPVDAEASLKQTELFWKEWSARSQYDGEWPEAVQRSLITLKALTYAPTGGLVAAPTTSLPELIGGERNWDYRYCWLRDSTLTLLALMDAGYFDEARAFREWLLRAVAGQPSGIRIMYGLAAERRLPEDVLDWLPGYEGSRPVRIGNAAAGQAQHDVFGEVMDALHQARQSGLTDGDESWALQLALLQHLERIWQQPDHGIWEVRDGPQHFTHSKIMAWVAMDRSIRSAEQFGLEGPVQSWRRARAAIHDDVCRKGYSNQLQSFVQTYGSNNLDASSLLIPIVGFLPASDPRVSSTVRAIQERLTVDGLVLRYRTEETRDGLPPGEGVFIPCSFWLADNLVMLGRAEEARQLFSRLLGLSNDVGLLSEEYDPHARRHLGNFPQAFSHLALVGTALNLARGPKPVEQRPSDVPSRPK
jgi:GH15 family glucan-1,4-alpha-glucosidase